MVFETIALLKGTTGSPTNNFANVLGYTTAGDGGGGGFYWDATATNADNGGTIFEVTGTTSGRWKRLYNGSVFIKWFGAKADGTDDSTNFKKIIDAFIDPTVDPKLGLNPNVIIESAPNAVYGIKEPIYIPFNVSINFNNATILPLAGGSLIPNPDSTIKTYKYMFYLNANPETELTVVPNASPNGFPSYISNLTIDNAANAADVDSKADDPSIVVKNTHPSYIFFSHSKHLIENIRTNHVQTLFLRNGTSNAEYNDSIHLNRIVAANSDNKKTAFYINNGWLGDNLKIEDMELHGAKLRVAYCQGGVLDRILNADIIISNCYGLTISNAHLENGNINIQNSVVKLSNIMHYYQGMIPLTIGNTASPYTVPAIKSCIIENYNVEYDDIRDVKTLPHDYSNDVFDAFISGSVTINNFFRIASNGLQPDMTTTATRITIDGTTSFDDYNTIPANSISSVIINGTIVSLPQSINNGIIADGVINKVYAVDSGRNNFLADTGTYYYRAVFLLGDARCMLATVINVADINFPVQKVPPSDTAKTAPVISDDSLRNGKSFTLRLYRGTTINSYDHYVNIPFTCFNRIIDYGFYISTGHFWQPRTFSPIDTFNVAPAGAVFSQNADGTKVVKLDAAPTVGKWKVGDKIDRITPVANSNGWICTSASPLTFIPR